MQICHKSDVNIIRLLLFGTNIVLNFKVNEISMPTLSSGADEDSAPAGDLAFAGDLASADDSVSAEEVTTAGDSGEDWESNN